jgi:hypothetical protein
MGFNKRPSVVLARLNTFKLLFLEELYTAIFLRVLPDGLRWRLRHLRSLPY